MRIRQQGLVEGPMLYVMAALGVSLAASIAWGMILSARLDGCRDSLGAARANIALQNSKVDELKADSDERVRMAEAARLSARADSQKSLGVATHLRAEATKASDPQQPVPAGSCQKSLADRAVAVIRGSL